MLLDANPPLWVRMLLGNCFMALLLGNFWQLLLHGMLSAEPNWVKEQDVLSFSAVKHTHTICLANPAYMITLHKLTCSWSSAATPAWKIQLSWDFVTVSRGHSKTSSGSPNSVPSGMAERVGPFQPCDNAGAIWELSSAVLMAAEVGGCKISNADGSATLSCTVAQQDTSKYQDRHISTASIRRDNPHPTCISCLPGDSIPC